jgi:hypothetical protein
MKLSTLRRMDELEEAIDEIPESKPISIVNLVKYSKQAYLQRKTRILIYPLRRSSPYLVPRKKCGQNSKDNLKLWIPQDNLSNHNIYAWWKRW